MARDDERGTMVYTPDPETAIRVGWWLTLVGVLIFIVSALGAYLGWWDLVGEVGMLIGTVLSIVLGVGTWLTSATTGQLSGVGEDVRSVGQDVRSVGENVQDVHEAVLANGIKLDKLDELDVIQAELDAQTGVLGEQLAVLRELRDQA